ncbi:amidohydrolase [Plantibacter sp. Mn2098]|uniref:amidohydrolase n=1 Tax=Plantibacter sp. Mn2098 TaxID=3395266 RepID=UPI003BE70045
MERIGWNAGGDGSVGSGGGVSGHRPVPRERLVIPGLVNAHTHAAMAVLRGLGDGLPLDDWLGVVQAAEARLTHDDLYWSLQLGLCELIRNGTSCFADMFFWDERLIDSVIEAGLRVSAAPAVFGLDMVGWPLAGGRTAGAQIAHTESLASTYAGEPLVQIMYGPHAPYTCGETVLRRIGARAAETGLGVHTHLSETKHEVTESLARCGLTPVQAAAEAGLLNARTLIAHGTWLTPADIELVAEAGASVAHCPQSNLKLGSGIAPVVEMVDAGVRVAIGTDGPASNDALDMLREMRLAASLQRGASCDAGALAADEVLGMATANGSSALGFDVTGPGGAPADYAVLDASGARAASWSGAGGFIAWSAVGHDVTDLVVGGRALLRDRELLTIDEERVLFEIDRIRRRLGVGESAA